MMPLKVCVLAYSPAPYRVELFDDIARGVEAIALSAVYVHRHEPGRAWNEQRVGHECVYLSDGDEAFALAVAMMRECDLAVVSYYATEAASRLWRSRIDSARPWVFWGERPGAHRRGLLGRVARRWRLRWLHGSDAAIWAIGNWAVEGYREEFGAARAYHRLPYFSDLARFAKAAAGRHSPALGAVRFLFCGSLTERKGVDVLIKAFARVRASYPLARLTFAGLGPLARMMRERAASMAGGCELLEFVDWESLPAVYAQHDVLVVPSRYDGWGMVVPEGLASGMPVIATDQMGAARDLIVAGENGWLARADDVGSLVDCLSQALRLDADDYCAASAAAQRSVAGHQLEDGAALFIKLCLDSAAVRRGDAYD